MQIIGHRGCGDHFPENTIAAIRGAAPHVDMIEIDVQRCGSGELVVFHDELLDRLTSATGSIRQTAFAKLQNLTIGESGEGIPTLERVLGELPPETGLNVELKHTGMEPAVETLLAERAHDVIVSAFDPDAFAGFPPETIDTAVLCHRNLADNLEIAAACGCAYLHPQYELVDAEAVTAAHNRDIQVNAWTVPTREAVRDCKESGVDGVIVDSWEIAQEPER